MACLLALLGSQTVVFIGDSLMRQVFTRTVAWLRGQSSLADPAWHSDAVYLADAEGDALVPLFLGYGAACALELVERNNQSSRCAEQLRLAASAMSRPEAQLEGLTGSIASLEALLTDEPAPMSAAGASGGGPSRGRVLEAEADAADVAGALCAGRRPRAELL